MMNPSHDLQYLPQNSGTKAILFSVFLFLFCGVILVAKQDLNSNQEAVPIATTMAFALLAFALLASTFVAIVTNSSKPENNNIIDHTFLISSLSFILALFEIVNYQYDYNPIVFFGISLIANSAIIFSLTQIVFALVKISGHWPRTMGAVNCVILFTLGLATSPNLRVGGFEESLVILGTYIHGVVASNFISIFLISFLVPSTRLSPHDFKQSIQKRFAINRENSIYLISFYTITGLSAVIFLSGNYLLLTTFNSSILTTNHEPHIPLSQFNPTFIPLFFLTIYILQVENAFSLQSRSLATLVSAQAKRFMQRYNSGRKNWSTTVGLRTANFMIDHDPQESARDVLPSYMVRIRKHQIESMVYDILKEKLIDNQIVSNQIYGAIDPENSTRSCIDVLLMFAAVYIDGIPMVENRLKNIVSLLPILDPDLSSKITENHIESTFSKIRWFFHLDFDWLDQHMTSTSNRTNYEVSIDNLRLRDRQKIISVLEQHKLMGNFIWIGEKARERILLEAPYLANTIEAWPLNISSQNKDSIDGVIFLIKFEQMIPRMQKYFNLEEIRKTLKYYEPSIDSRRMLNIIDMEIHNTSDLKGFSDIISLVNNYPWSGFKEKDLALQILVKAFRKYSNAQSQNSISNKILKEFVSTVNRIGYPSQEIHTAHLEKIRIRKPQIIKKAITNQNSPRFIEAWLLLGSTAAKNYSKDDLIDLLDCINLAATTLVPKRLHILPIKVAEAYFNVCQELDEDNILIITKTLNNIVNFLIACEANPESFCFLIDGKIFLEGNLKFDILLTKDTLDSLQFYFSHLYEKYSSSRAIVHSLSLRWRILMNQNPLSEEAS